jgi:biopolymer transport protein ExbB
MLTSGFSKLAAYISAGGFVMIPLALSCLVIWFGIGYRASVLHRPDARNVRRLLEKHRAGKISNAYGVVERAVVKGLRITRSAPVDLRSELDVAFSDDEEVLYRHSRLVKSLIAVAPILGLLGTVGGMIETFVALGEMQLVSQGGGIAGGIAKALFTTQLGLAVSIPALVVNSVLERRAANRVTELTQLKDMLCANAPEIRLEFGDLHEPA